MENRLRALKARGHDIRVVSPVPWFPASGEIFGDYAAYADPPAREHRHDIDIRHPQYLLIPKLGMRAAVGALERCFEAALAEARAEGFEPELIDAHYLYPDGVAAARAARRHGLPVVLTARGSDVTLLPAYPAPRRMILEAVRDADHTVTVAEALRRDLITLGGDPSQITTIRNGVDTTLFHPDAPAAAAMTAGGGARPLLSVGHLIPRKGHDLVIRALKGLPGRRLVIVGGGSEEPALRQLAERKGVADRVTFAGEVPHTELPGYYAHAAALVLGSDREGWPNVLLEAMACGTPCVATPAGGVAEVITAPEAGIVTGERSPKAIAEAVLALEERAPDRAATRAYAEAFAWDDVADMVEKVWQRAAARSSAIGWGVSDDTLLAEETSTNFLLTVDTEELFDWNAPPSEYLNNRLPDLDAFKRLQGLCDDKGITPLYVVTEPLLKDDAIGEMLAGWAREGRAGFGLHLHSWATSPLPASITPAESYQLHLDPDLHRQKLTGLARIFEARIGHRALAHRAGRYGIAPWVLDQLAETGIRLDFSPSAGFDFRPLSGPDFTDYPAEIRRRETPFGPQWVIPVSGLRLWRGLSTPLHIKPEMTGWQRHLLSQASVAVRLTPEGNPLEVMQKVARALSRQGLPLLTPTLHLSSLVAGATPYTRDATEVTAMLEKLGAYIDWAKAEGHAPTSLDKIAGGLGLTGTDNQPVIAPKVRRQAW